MTKSLTNRLYLKQRMYHLKIEPGTSMSDHIDQFNQVMLDLNNIGEKIKDEDRALVLLCSLLQSYDNFVDTMLYGRTSITLEDVKASLNSREFKKEGP